MELVHSLIIHAFDIVRKSGRRTNGVYDAFHEDTHEDTLEDDEEGNE